MDESVRPIIRQALGRVAGIGDLYDARTDTFCATSLWKGERPSFAIEEQANNHSNVSFITGGRLDEKLNTLDVNGDLKLSILAGMVDPDGAAKYLVEKKESFKSVESAVVYHVSTVVERLHILRDDVRKCISEDALNYPTATHVVVEIYWGANCAIRVTHKNCDDKRKEEVEGSLATHVQKLKAIVSADGKVEKELTEEETESWKNFSLDIYGDVLPSGGDKLPATVDEAVKMMRNMPRLIQNSGDGKGKQLTYVMFPLSALRDRAGINITIHPITERIRPNRGQIVEIMQIFDHISELIQKSHDQVEEINNQKCCVVTATERKEANSLERDLRVQEANLRDDLKKAVQKLRADNSDSRSLTDLCDEYRTKANESSERCKSIYDEIHSRISFVKRCKEFGVECLESPVVEKIGNACDEHDDVYVFYYGKADATTTPKTQRYQSAFVELAKKSINDKTTGCYMTWAEKSEDVRIEHHRLRRLLHKDVINELETGVLPCQAKRQWWCIVV